MWETWVRSLAWEDPWRGGMATHSSILAQRIPGTEEPGRLPSGGSQRVRHNWVIFIFTFFHFQWIHSHIINVRVGKHKAKQRRIATKWKSLKKEVKTFLKSQMMRKRAHNSNHNKQIHFFGKKGFWEYFTFQESLKSTLIWLDTLFTLIIAWPFGEMWNKGCLGISCV